MSLKSILNDFFLQKQITEGFDPEGNPDLKYYAFDWDDNIVTMPTQIITVDEDGNEVGISTEDFATYREIIGIKPFSYKGKTIVNYAEEPYRNFRVNGDKAFIIDSLLATPGPSWDDFVECINGGSIFAIITARGHNPSTLREGVYNMIVTNHNGINKDTLVSNLQKYREFVGDQKNDSTVMINEYLDLCKYYPVSFEEGSASNPEEGKIKALKEFIGYITKLSSMLGKSAFLKNDVKNNFTPQIGFSDDDPRNIEKIKNFLEKEYKNKPVKTYLTKGGDKKEI